MSAIQTTYPGASGKCCPICTLTYEGESCPTAKCKIGGQRKVTGLTVVSYGAGTNSTAMLIEMLKRGERVDLITFADTGGELPETYKYKDMFSNWLQDQGYPEIITVIKGGLQETLEQNCLRMRSLPSVVYGYKTCSLKYKIQPQEKFINNWQPAKEEWKRGAKVIKCLGFDAGEPQRAKFTEDKKYIWRYPLLEYSLDRDACIKSIKAAGLPLPGKSSCFFCPNSSAHEIISLPCDLKKRAIALENNSQLTTMRGLGRDWKWSELLESDRKQLKIFKSNEEMPCECFDG